MGSFAPRGHARLDPRRPMAFAICDRCGFLYRHADLVWDTQYHGRELKRTGFLVCRKCDDVPNPTLRPIVLPPDPVPIRNPRSEPVHCHIFKPKVDNNRPLHPAGPLIAGLTADTFSVIDPPIADTRPRPVTVDRGATCDTRTYKDGWSVPIPIPPIFPPEPPIDPPDATTDNDQVTADTTGTTADASPIKAYDFTTDTTVITADTMTPTADAFPLAEPPPAADTTWLSADAMSPTTDASPFPWIYTQGNTADTIEEVADDQMAPTTNVNAFPDYLEAADVVATKADTITVDADNLT